MSTNNQSDSSKRAKSFVISILRRYFRYAPVMLFFMLFHATWAYRLGSGPFWDKIVYAERKACRLNMWKNLLFINNYARDNLKCMGHTWFIASDFYLSVIGITILLIARR